MGACMSSPMYSPNLPDYFIGYIYILIAIWAAGMWYVTVFLVCLLQQDITSWLLQAFLSCMNYETCMHDIQARRLMQETQYELWIPVYHTTQLQHWTAATDALDHVILTTAALESVLEGILSGSDAAVTEHQQMMHLIWPPECCILYSMQGSQ